MSEVAIPCVPSVVISLVDGDIIKINEAHSRISVPSVHRSDGSREFSVIAFVNAAIVDPKVLNVLLFRSLGDELYLRKRLFLLRQRVFSFRRSVEEVLVGHFGIWYCAPGMRKYGVRRWVVQDWSEDKFAFVVALQ